MKSTKYFSLFMLLSIATTALSMDIIAVDVADANVQLRLKLDDVDPNITVAHPTHVQEIQEKRKQQASDQESSPRETKRRNTTQTNN